MSTFKSSATHFILVTSIFVPLSLASAATTNYLAHYCTNGSYFHPDSIFEDKLTDLLYSFLFSMAAFEGLPHDGFYRTTMAQGEIKGLFLCRGDVNATLCHNCVSDAAVEIRRRCTNQTESIIWYDVCMLRYSNDSYLNNIVPGMNLLDEKNVSDSELEQFTNLLATTLNDVAEQAMNSASGKKFATKEAVFTGSQKLYTLAQCTPDLSSSDCNTCFRSAIAALPTCCNGKQGAHSLLPACIILRRVRRVHAASASSNFLR